MARTIEEIKKEMATRFLQDADLREAYGIEEGASWEATFSTVSVENLLLYIVAACVWGLEVLFDAHKEEVDRRIAANVVPTVRWYHTQALAFQYGDAPVFDEATQGFRYAVDDPEKQIVRFCAVRDEGSSIRILAAKEGEGGAPAPLSDDELRAFTAYMNQVKIAGVLLDIASLAPDSISIFATVQVDPQVIRVAAIPTAGGQAVSGGGKPVAEAIDAYLAGIAYGGVFNKTRCTDAIQAVPGVIDVDITRVMAKPASAEAYAAVEGNNYEAVGGCFVSNGLEYSISYVERL